MKLTQKNENMGDREKKHKEGVYLKNDSLNRFPLFLWNGRSLMLFTGSIIASLTFMIYLPALKNDFVNWDDLVYVSENFNIRSLDARFFKWDLTAIVVSLWHPLTNLSHALDYAVWGLNPLGHHLTNILLHVMNTFLVFIAVIILFEQVNGWADKKKIVVGGITALLFGIHPVHVESVAWVSERKDVLSAFFFLMTLIFYVKYIYFHSSRKPRKLFFYIASLVFFILAILSKPMVVSLPLILLIIDWYPLKRITLKNEWMNTKGVFVEKIPFFLLSILSSLMTLWAQKSTGALMSLTTYPFVTRFFIAGRSLVLYLLKILFPENLAPFYPLSTRIEWYRMEYLGVCALLVIFIVVILAFRKNIFIAIGAYYIIMLIPVLGIIQVGSQTMADRYTYLPSIGPLFLAGLGVFTVFDRCARGRDRIVICTLAFLFVGIMGYKTIRQIWVWRDSISLWSHELRIYPNLAKGYINLGDAYTKSGDYIEAIKNFNIAVILAPENDIIYFERGCAHYELGNYNQAVFDFNSTIALNPKMAEAYYYLGHIFLKSGNVEQASFHYKKAADLGLKEAQDALRVGLR